MTENKNLVSASYHGPSEDSFTASREVSSSSHGDGSGPLPTTSDLGLADKTAYLQGLRAAVSAVQDMVNKELTIRMEADKAREAGTSAAGTAAAAAAAAAAPVNEADEEQNYGEEVVDDDDGA